MSENIENMTQTDVYTSYKIKKKHNSGKYGFINIDKDTDINAFVDTIVCSLDANTSYDTITQNVKVTIPLLRALCIRYKLYIEDIY